MNLVRAGHYFVGDTQPDEDCNTATVVHVFSGGGSVEHVRVVWYDHQGHGPYIAEVAVDPSTHPQNSTFHLSGDCPWKR